MAEDDVSKIVLQGAAVWNAWREQTRSLPLTFSAPHWYDSPGRNGKQVKGRNKFDFSGMNLSGVSIYKAFAEGLNLRGAEFNGTLFEEGDFSRADFREACFRNTRLNKTILTGANFDGATFVNCNLNRANLVGASFRVKEITETVVYGISAWDLVTSDETKQSKLIIEKTYDLYTDLIQQNKIPVMVDDIELAEFIHYLSNHKKIRETLNILNNKSVLILGRFANGGLDLLYSIGDWFRSKGYLPMIFDFQRPDSLSLTETAVTMAGLSKFIVVDLSGPSVPAELQAILMQLKKPILAFGNPYSLFPDLADHTSVRTIETTNLFQGLEEKLPEMEKLQIERIQQLAQRHP